MICQNETEFAQRLKNFEPDRVYFLYGEQNYLKRLYVKKLMERAVGTSPTDFDLIRMDGAQADIDQIADAAESFSLMGGRKCVVITDLDVGKLSAVETGKLQELLTDPPGASVLVFTTSDVAPDVKKNAKWKAFCKLVDASGVVMELRTRSTGDRNRFLQSLAERAGCRISAENCVFLADRCGDDMQVLQNEMNKLCAYKGDGEMTRDDIRLCAVARLDASVFDLAKLICKNDYQGAMQNLNELLTMREEPVAILGALSGGFIDLYRAKAAAQNGHSAEELCALYRSYKGKEWRIKNAMRDCGRYSRKQLATVLVLLAQADFRLKSSRTDHTILLQEALTRICAALHGNKNAPA